MYETNLKTPGGTAKNTDLINSSVMRLENGTYAPDLENPYVEDF